MHKDNMKLGIYDSVVVGAGISALLTAQRLSLMGRRVVILEGRSRIGGRLVATEQGFDLGAAWCWPSQERILSGLAKDLGIETFPQPADGMAVMEPGGMQFPDEGAAGPGAIRFRGGLGGLTKRLAETLNADLVTIYTDQAVSQVQTNQDSVMVTSTSSSGEMKEWQARTCIITAPPRVAATSINFSPQLNKDQREAMLSISTWMGETTKIVLEYETNWWQKHDALSGAVFSHVGPLSQIWDNSDAEQNLFALAAFSFDKHAQYLRNLNDDELAKVLTKQLGRAFSVSSPPLPIAIHSAHWITEPFTYAKPPSALPDTRNYGHKLLSQPHHEAVFFAGTETEPYHGHVEGALRSALRVTDQVQAFLIKQENASTTCRAATS
uniref:monoamine oxidase n=1 Tax=Aureoumbra lagunensis TaxID=44058 RepID=A0A7S3K399_9STRA